MRGCSPSLCDEWRECVHDTIITPIHSSAHRLVMMLEQDDVYSDMRIRIDREMTYRLSSSYNSCMFSSRLIAR